MSLKNESKLPFSTSSRTTSDLLMNKKPINGDSLRNEVQDMILDLSSSNEKDEDGDDLFEAPASSSSSTASSDDENGVFDARCVTVESICSLILYLHLERISR
jgi:hypothetical protein